jgi:site-specific recombinase XerD
MPRTPKLTKKNGYWCTKAGSPNGVYFGKVSEVPYSEAKTKFAEYLSSLGKPEGEAIRSVFTALELCDRFVDWLKEHRGDRTCDERNRHLSRFCNFQVGSQLIADLPADKVQASDLIAFKKHIAEKYELDQFTVDKHATSIKHAWNWATKHPSPVPHLPVTFRPFASVEKYKRPDEPLVEEDLLKPKQVQALFDWADVDLTPVRRKGKYRERSLEERRATHRFTGFLHLLKCYYHTGARTSELAEVRVRDFLRQTRQLVLGRHKRSRTMKDPRARRITLNEEAHAIIERYCAGKEPDQRIFLTQAGKTWTRKRLDDRFAAIREKAGVPQDHTIYSFRHLWISQTLMAGVEIATVAVMAGTSVSMIEKVYGHFTNDHLAAAQERLDKVRRGNQLNPA